MQESTHFELPSVGGPLHARTWDIDRSEGQTVNELIAASQSPIEVPAIEVPEDLQRNLMVTSVDAPGELEPEIGALARVVRIGVLRL